MHCVNGLSMEALEARRPIDRAVAREAARWLSCLYSGETNKQDELAACARWRAANPEHERAWQCAQRLNQKFDVIPPVIGVAALGRPVRVDRRTAIKAFMALIISAPVGYVAYRAIPWREWTADYCTNAGERRTIELDDGTRVQLGTATKIDVHFTEGQRLLVLHVGEILITTGADSHSLSTVHRPFTVKTKHGRIRALGTRFVVRQTDSDSTLVAVMQGAVEIRPKHAGDAQLVVNAGEQTRFSLTDVVAPVPTDPHIADWSRGVLFANKMRLEDFIAELGRYRSGVLRCDPDVANLHITGAFQLDHTDSVLAALPDTLPVDVIYRTRYWVSVMAQQEKKLH